MLKNATSEITDSHINADTHWMQDAKSLVKLQLHHHHQKLPFDSSLNDVVWDELKVYKWRRTPPWAYWQMTSLIRRTVCGFVQTRRAKLFCQSILGLTCRHKLGLIYSSSLNYSTVNTTVFYCFNVMQILSCWLDSVFYCWIILFYLLPGLLVSSVRRLEPIGKCSKKMGPMLILSMNVQYRSKLSCAIILFLVNWLLYQILRIPPHIGRVLILDLIF